MSDNLGTAKSTVKVVSWSAVKPPSRRSDNRTLFCQNPQEVTFEEPVKRHSLTVSLVSLMTKGCLNSTEIPKVGIPKPGIPKKRIPKTGIPKVGKPTLRFPARQIFPKPGILKPGIPKTGIPKAGDSEAGDSENGQIQGPLSSDTP